jgi:hypothetical protein
LTYNKLLKSCDIGLSTVIMRSTLFNTYKFPSIKTKEDYVLWLKLATGWGPSHRIAHRASRVTQAGHDCLEKYGCAHSEGGVTSDE